jgi:LPXTG-motif cell wall-anchored protein
VTAITPVCVNDAPFVRVTFGNQPEFNGRPATVTFIDINGVTVATHSATYTAGGSLTFVYPGASVDAAGNPTDWPGWVFDGDEWVPDPTDSYLRDGLTVRVDVNPTATGQVSYPPATSACADPERGGATTTVAGALPATGAASGGLAWAAGLSLALGVGAVLLSRRRAA